MRKKSKIIVAAFLAFGILGCIDNNKNMEQLDSFKIIGISVETTNENGKSAEDLGKLWGQFYAKNIPAKIPNKVSDDVYAIYTDYETDYTGSYKAIIGIKVRSLDQIPDGLTGRVFEKGKYQKFTAKGAMPAAVVEAWEKIWQEYKNLNRSYTADFEVYSQKSSYGKNAEVDIYIAVE